MVFNDIFTINKKWCYVIAIYLVSKLTTKKF